MSVVIVKTNELCSVCIYLPAEDIPGTKQRTTAIECNDLCRNCIKNCKKLFVCGLNYDNPDEKKLSDRVRKNSPWLKSQGLV